MLSRSIGILRPSIVCLMIFLSIGHQFVFGKPPLASIAAIGIELGLTHYRVGLRHQGGSIDVTPPFLYASKAFWNCFDKNTIDAHEEEREQEHHCVLEMAAVSATLREIKIAAEGYYGQEVNYAVIAVPSNFIDSQRQLVASSGLQANFDEIRVISRNVAACMGHGLPRMQLGESTVVVYDLGSSPSEVSIISIEDGVFEVVTRKTRQSIEGTTFNTLNEDVDEMIFVGESNHISKLREIIQDHSKVQEFASEDSEDLVAKGAAIQAANVWEYEPGCRLVDVTPLSLGIETFDGAFQRVIHRQSVIPTRTIKTYDSLSTIHDNQSDLLIRVFEGEWLLTEGNALLGMLDFPILEPLPRGVPRIELVFEVDASMNLKVVARNQDISETIRIQNADMPSATNATHLRLHMLHAEALQNDNRLFDKYHTVDQETRKESVIFVAGMENLLSPAYNHDEL